MRAVLSRRSALVAGLAALGAAALAVTETQLSVGQESYDAIVARFRAAAPERREKIDREYLLDFNSGKRNYWELPPAELAVSGSLPYSLKDAVGKAQYVAMARVVGVNFFSSEVAEIPAATITYEIVESFAGDLKPGLRVFTTGLSGPHRDEGGEFYLHLPEVHIERPGQRTLLLLTHTEGAVDYEQVHFGNQSLFDAQGKIEANLAGRESAVAGKSEAEVVALVREMLGQKPR